MMSMRGVMTSATMVSARAKTPPSISRSRCPPPSCPPKLSRTLRSTHPTMRKSGWNGISVRSARRCTGRATSGAIDATRRGRRSATTQTRPTAARSRASAGHWRIGPPGNRATGHGARQDDEHQVREVEAALEPERAVLLHARREEPGQFRLGLRSERQPRGPEREHAGEQRGQEELQCRHQPNRLHVALLPPPHGRAGAVIAIGMIVAEHVQGPMNHEAHELLPEGNTVPSRIARCDRTADVDVTGQAPRRGPRGRS